LNIAASELWAITFCCLYIIQSEVFCYRSLNWTKTSCWKFPFQWFLGFELFLGINLSHQRTSRMWLFFFQMEKTEVLWEKLAKYQCIHGSLHCVLIHPQDAFHSKYHWAKKRLRVLDLPDVVNASMTKNVGRFLLWHWGEKQWDHDKPGR
jgi:hypothetical protein